MLLLKRIVISLGALVLLLVGIGLILPSHFRVERSTLINASPATIYAKLEDPKAWKEWTVWNQRDPAMQLSYSGPEKGKGAGWAWKSETEGNGSMSFSDSQPNSQLTYQLSFPDFGMNSTGVLKLEALGNQTKISWSNEGELGNNPVNRYFGLMMDSMVGKDFEAGLANLKSLVEHGKR